MSADDRVKVLEGEFKLIKSELRQTLGSVRDFLLDLKIPQIQEEARQQAEAQTVQTQPQTDLGGGSSGGGGSDQQPAQSTAPQSGFGGYEPEMEPVQDTTAPPELPVASPENYPQQPVAEEEEEDTRDLGLSDELESDDSGITSGDMPGLEEPAEGVSGPEEVKEMKPEEIKSTTPQVNLLANLIRWVSMAKKEIGVGQLPVFLDVYATTGNLNQQTKDTILHLAEVATDPAVDNESPEKKGVVTEEIAICMEINGYSGQLPPEFKEKVRRLTELILRQTVYANKADIWSQLLLELHGILTGGGASLQPLGLIEKSETEESKDDQGEGVGDGVEEQKEEPADSVDEVEEVQTPKSVKPARLRLVLPANDGMEQELDLGSLFISTETAPDPEPPLKKGNGHKNTVTPKR